MQDAVIKLLRCPICAGDFAREGNSLVCLKRHCYDIARQGHVNLAPAAKDSFYTKALFESRAKVFEAGVFAPVVEAIGEAIERHVQSKHPVLLDAGCGEGYYTKAVCPEREMMRIGFDLSKEAVRLAARGEKTASFFVGDLAHIPIMDHSADVLLDVFTPANYAEFARVLRPDGIVVKLAPRAGYLKELREAASGLLRRGEYDGGQVERYAADHMDILEKREITYSMPVTQELVHHIARMTPMLAGIDVDKLDLTGIARITIDETLTVGRMRAA